MPNPEIFEALETGPIDRSEARSNHKEKNRRIADHQRERLTNSLQGRMAMLRNMLDLTVSKKIPCNREGQIIRFEPDCQTWIDEFDETVKEAEPEHGPCGV